jgi:hypothetical protein
MLVVLCLACSASAEPEAPLASPPCPTSVLVALDVARAKHADGQLGPAQALFERVLGDPGLGRCSANLQLAIRREYATVLVQRGDRSRARGNQGAGAFYATALTQYRAYLDAYLAQPWPIGTDAPESPRLVLKAYGDTLFKVGRFRDICDFYATVASTNAQVFDLDTVELWWTTLQRTWDGKDMTVRLAEYCALAGRPIAMADGSRKEMFARCTPA